ncbi:MAG: uncharacterized protein QOF36_2424, partial [Microbacteriaceae bacterium]|nr:uncharacterized protein [Microbacteriaceae bacterium]
DVYKLIEAMAWEIGRTGDEAMNDRLVALVERIAPVQEPDGYLNTAFGRPGQPARYSDLEWGHELYSYGHLIQAAIARGRTYGEDLLVSIARRAADHICETFGESGIQRVCGHPEIEVALVEFARFTGENKYLDQAKLFIERRGHGTLGAIGFGQSYFQDDVPLRDTDVMSGHAVRALYLAAGGIDLAIETGDDELLRSLMRQTANTVAHRTYITGGMGSHHEGESFGLDFELPPDRAYSETCAGVGSIMVNYRLLLATGDVRYANLIERTLFNVVATSPAADGEAFFYTNTLHQRTPGSPPSLDEASARASSSLRAPWFEVSCCPTNVARTLASLGAYVATKNERGIQLHQLADAEIRTSLDDDNAVALRVSTEYPTTGAVRIEVLSSADREWTLSVRVPDWAAGATVAVNGGPIPATPGYVEITRAFSAGDVVEVAIPVSPRWTWADPRVDAVRGTVAVERGPLVMCIESVDLPEGADVNGIRVLTQGQPHDVDGGTAVDVVTADLSDAAWPYRAGDPAGTVGRPQSVELIPYHQWANRGPSTMRVWLPIA